VRCFLASAAALCLVEAAAVAQAAWMARPGLSSRYSFAAAYDAARSVTVLFGGNDGVRRNDCWTWNGTDWTELSPVHRPSARNGHAMVYDVLRQRVVLYGGDTSSFSSTETWVWDGVDWTQLFPAHNPGPIGGHTMVYDIARDRVVLWYGTSGGSFGSLWEFDGVDWQQVPTVGPNWPLWVAPPTMCYDPASATTALYRGVGASGSMWRWNGTVWTAETGPSFSQLFGPVMVFDAGQARLLLVGGIPAAPGTPPTVLAWQSTTNSWQPLTADGPYAANHAVVHDALRNCLVFVGGSRPGTTTDTSVWEWDGVQWDRRTHAAPGARAGHTMAADLVHDRIVLYGGTQPTQFGDTWVRDQGRWDLRIPKPSLIVGGNHPGAVRYCRLVYDEARDSVLLIGGCCSSPFPFWRLVGDQWQAIPGVMPSGREDPGVVYDRRRQRVVMFGGDSLTSGVLYLNETWVWDGLNWTQLNPVHSPQARSNPGMAYDLLRDRIVLLGGVLVGGASNDTWEFDGVDWHQFPSGVMPASTQPRLAYDSARQAIVAFLTPNNGPAQTWQWNGVAWTQIATATTPSQPSVEPALVGTANEVLLTGGRWLSDYFATEWSLQTPTLASVEAFGPSTASAAGPLLLRGTGSLPWIGSCVRVALGPLPFLPLPGLWFGSQRLVPALDLGSFGWPGREALIFLDAPVPAVNDGQGGAYADIDLPYESAFLGTMVHFQGFVYEPLSGELTTSNGVSMTFGAR
jgi:hypothetical protein